MVVRRTVLVAATVPFTGCVGGPILPVPRIAEQSCPPLELPEPRAVCSHTTSSDGPALTVTQSNVSTAPEALSAVRLLIENGTDVTLRYDPSSWRLYRNTGLGWSRRGETYGGLEGVETMPPGGSASWSGLDGLFDLGAATRTLPGLYAGVLPVQPVEPGDDGGGRIACVFLFRVARDRS